MAVSSTSFQPGNQHVFKPGNQLAAGSSYDIDAECAYLDAWSQKDDSYALIDYAASRNTHPQRVYEWRDKSPAFAEVLKLAKARMASRMRRKLLSNEYNYGLFMREIHHHDGFLNASEDAEKDKDAQRTRENTSIVNDEFKTMLVSYMSMLSSKQLDVRVSTVQDAISSSSDSSSPATLVISSTSDESSNSTVK